MNPSRHRGEASLAWTSLAVLMPYVIGETWVAWPHLTGPGYLIDAMAWALLLFGAPTRCAVDCFLRRVRCEEPGA